MSTRSRSRPTRTGAAPSRRSPRSRPICARVADRRGPAARTSASAASCSGAAWDADDQRWRLETSRGSAHRPGADRRARARCSEPTIPDVARPRALRGHASSTPRSWDHDARPRRRAGRGDRHRRERDPVRAPRSSREVAQLHALPAHGAVDHAPPRPRAHPRRAALYRASARRAAADAPRDLLGARGVRDPDAARRRWRRHRAGSALAHLRPPGPRPRAAREAHPGLRAGLQADPDLQRLPAVARRAERRAGHRRRSPRSASARS